jgi:hypothetical protein
MKRLLVICLCILTKLTAFSQAADTSLWAPNGPVNAILLKDSLLFVGGDFDQVSPVTGGFVSIDSASGIVTPPFPFVYGKINCMVRDSLGYVYVGGSFARVGSTYCANLFRLTPQGNFDPNFRPDPNGEVFELMICWHTLYVGGNFASFDGSTRGRGAAVYLPNDSLTPWNPTADGPVYALCADMVNGQIIIGGDFMNVGAATIAYLGKVNRDDGHYIALGNSFWTAIPQVFGPVKALAVYGQKIFVAGDFNSFASIPSPGIGVLDLDAATLQTVYNAGLDGFVEDLDLIDQKIYVGGSFTHSGSVVRNHLACFDTNLNLLPWNPSADGNVNAIEPSLDSNVVYIAGAFHMLGSDTAYNGGKALTDSAGTVLPWNPMLNNSSNCIFPSTIPGIAWVGGIFTGAGGVFRENLCAINILTKTANSWNPKVNLPVTTICADNSTLFISGNFTNINSQARNRLAAFDLSTCSLTSFNPGVNGAVRTMVSDNVNLFLGGNFTIAGGQSRNNIASITISNATTTTWNPGCAGTVNKLLLDGNALYVGGFFTQCGGQFRDNLARLNSSTGLADWSWSCNTDDGVYDIDLYNGQLLAGGWFQHADGQSRKFIAAVDTVSGNVLPFNPVFDNYIRGFSRWNDDLFISGAFISVNNNIQRPHLCDYDLGDASFDSWNPTPDIFPETMQSTQNELYIGGDFSNIGYRFHPYLCAFNVMWVTGMDESTSSFSPMKIWPNPSGDLVNIKVPGNSSATFALRIIDINGKMIREEKIEAGVEFYSMDVEELAAGMYTLMLVNEEGMISSARLIRE